MKIRRMGISPIDLRLRIIRPALYLLPIKYSISAENLLLGTCAQESLMGHYLCQKSGPALGIYQMEPDTYYDIWENFLKYKPEIKNSILKQYNINPCPPVNLLVYDLIFSTMMVRIHYFRFSQELPEADDVIGMAKYWKKYYNSYKGKGKIDDFISNFNYFDLL